jgi:hypothetical protein
MIDYRVALAFPQRFYKTIENLAVHGRDVEEGF